MTNYNPKLQDPGIKYPDLDPSLDFNNYVDECQRIIRTYRQDLKGNPLSETIIAANSPYELKPVQPSGYGALVIHGLYDCPFTVKDIAEHLQQNNLLVRSILLPGHGTVPGSLLNIRYEDWLQTACYGIENLSRDVKKLFLVGYSTGGTIALYHFLNNTYRHLAGLILISPALKIYSPFAFATSWPSYIATTWKRAAWLDIAPEIDYARYQSFTFNSAYQVYTLARLTNALQADKKISTPIFIVMSQDDRTVSSTATLAYFKARTEANSRILLYSNNPIHDNDPRIVTRTASYPELNIINISHIAVPIAPENSHYGKNGDYALASHVDENALTKQFYYGTYNNFQNKFLRLFHRMGLHQQQRIRLTFNPDFVFLKQQISDFVVDSIKASETTN